jgi:hypothetical protein
MTHNACHYAECLYNECHYAECRGTCYETFLGSLKSKYKTFCINPIQPLLVYDNLVVNNNKKYYTANSVQNSVLYSLSGIINSSIGIT